jgi:MFS family permease
VFLDLTPLRASREFRLLWIGQAISDLGSGITLVAVPFQVFELTHSSLAVGLLSMFELFPLLAMSLFGGALADATDRRRLLIWVNASFGVCSLLLAMNARASTEHLWPLYALAVITAGLYSIHSPALESWVPRLVSQELLPSANALNIAYGAAGMLIGPAIGGLLIAAVGLPVAYLLDAGTFLAAILALSMMSASPPSEQAHPPGWHAVVQGLRYVRGASVVRGFLGLELATSFLGVARSLFPAMAVRLGGGPKLLGLLYAAPLAGEFAGNLVSGWIGRVRRQGLASAAAVAVYGAALAGFGLSRTLWLSLAMLAVSGAAEIVRAIYRITALQAAVPDRLRGRVLGIDVAVITSGPALGNIEAGILASVASVPGAVVAGGLACVLAGAVAAGVPSLSRFGPSPASPADGG